MVRVPKKVSDRLTKQLSAFQRVLQNAKDRDVNESDTVTIVTDMLARVFGFDKYTEITSEQAIRGTYCDLAVTVNGAVQYLIEVKAIGLNLKDNHIRQAVSYGANHGIPWVVLTNGIVWEVYRIKFEKPLNHELVCQFDLLALSPRESEHQELLFLLCKEGVGKDAMKHYHEHLQSVNRFVLAALIQSDAVLTVLRRELKRLSADSRATMDEVQALLGDVLKRDVIEGDAAAHARRQVQKAAHRSKRKSKAATATVERSADSAATDVKGS